MRLIFFWWSATPFDHGTKPIVVGGIVVAFAILAIVLLLAVHPSRAEDL